MEGGSQCETNYDKEADRRKVTIKLQLHTFFKKAFFKEKSKKPCKDIKFYFIYLLLLWEKHPFCGTGVEEVWTCVQSLRICVKPCMVAQSSSISYGKKEDGVQRIFRSSWAI